MIQCQICDKYYKSMQSLSKHITQVHQISKQDYYDTYVNNINTCLICGNKTKFIDLSKGYTKFCCRSHQVKYQQMNLSNNNRINQQQIRLNNYKKYEKENNCTQISKLYKKYGDFWINDIPIIEISKRQKYVKNEYIPIIENMYNNRLIPNNNVKIHKRGYLINKEYEKTHNCTRIGTLIEKYGQGWLSLNIPKIIRNKNARFISNDYIPIIEKYANKNHSYRSKKECQLYETITNIYKHTVYHNSRNIIPHYELDVYIPKLKIAFEFNGIKWHSIENGMNKDYHLNKSLICRQNGIRLVHIYEFEDFNEQLNLAKQLVQGYDYYNKNDFNKNNLLDFIPKAEIVYKSNYYTIYGAGLLYK